MFLRTFICICALALVVRLFVSVSAPPLDLKDYGAYLDGVHDDSPAYAAAIADASSGIKGTHEILFTGYLTLFSQPPPLNQVHLRGSDMLGSAVLKKFAGGVLFWFNGSLPGGGLHNLSVPQDVGTPGSYTILVQAQTTYAPDALQLEHLYLGSGTGPGPFRTIEINGSARPALGVRCVRMSDLSCFGTSSSPNVYLTYAVNCSCHDVRIYPAGGTYGDVGGSPNPAFVWDAGCVSDGYWVSGAR